MEARLTDDLVDRVLARVGLRAPPAPTRDGLRDLYRAWCDHVPWDNVQKRITVAAGRVPLGGAEPAEFFENFLSDGTGGTCWPSAGGLHALLAHLGFPARRAIAAMGHDRMFRVPTHGTTIVRLDGEDLLVDSSILHVEPVVLRDGSSLDDPAHRLHVERTASECFIWWTLHGRDEQMVCRLLQDDVPQASYLELYEASRVTGFSYFLTFTKNVGGGTLVVNGHRRAYRDAAGTVTSGTVGDRGRVLVDEGGLSEAIVGRLPSDQPDPNRPVQQATG
jgi:N-hydroxyarylamine O-acetyltransferase